MDNPAEELNYLGDITVPKTNNWYGYPTCFTVWDPEAITDTALSVGDQMVLAPNATFNDATCAQRSVPARLGFPAHTAPLDSKFDAAGENLYVSLHGSWNRQPPQGYKLVAVPFAKGEDGRYAPVAGRDSRAGYEDVLYPADEGSCSASTCVRPVGLVFDAMGRLYMTADASGEVFLLARG
jgi:glucose/arabinose dehydrogenase